GGATIHDDERDVDDGQAVFEFQVKRLAAADGQQIALAADHAAVLEDDPGDAVALGLLAHQLAEVGQAEHGARDGALRVLLERQQALLNAALPYDGVDDGGLAVMTLLDGGLLG